MMLLVLVHRLAQHPEGVYSRVSLVTFTHCSFVVALMRQSLAHGRRLCTGEACLCYQFT